MLPPPPPAGEVSHAERVTEGVIRSGVVRQSETYARSLPRARGPLSPAVHRIASFRIPWLAPGHVHPPLQDVHPLGEAFELGEEALDLRRELIAPVLGEAQPLFQGAQALVGVRRARRVCVVVGGR